MNFRTHPKPQADALSGVLSEVGFVQSVVVNQRSGHLIDGHLRVGLAQERGEESIPVVYVDLDEREEMLILATLDPIGAMAGVDSEALDALMHEVSSGDAAIQTLLDSIGHAPDIVQYGESEEGKSPEDQQEVYESGIVRQIVLIYGSEEYDEIWGILEDLRESMGVETNTDVITAILREYHATH